MLEFILNGEIVNSYIDMYLIDDLRDIMHITSVKRGCEDGSCGACMLIIDGVATYSCHKKISDILGKSVITVEGLDEEEKEVYVYAFKTVGAVQCGYCTPAMIMSAKALIDEYNLPSKYQIKKAISKNICRCTGYAKIEKAIELASRIFAGIDKIQKSKSKGKIGEILSSEEVDDKILGIAKYTDDLYMKDMLYGGALRLDVPRAFIKSIDYTKALNHKDTVAIIDKNSLKKSNKVGLVRQDTPVFVGVGEETRCISDAICAIASKTKKGLKEALSLVEVEYEELKPITHMKDALKKDAYDIHKDGNILQKVLINRGDVDSAIKNSKYVITNNYSVPMTDHAFLETESALAYVKDEDLILYTSAQNVSNIRKQLVNILDLPENNIKVVIKNVGGDFGGKNDITVQHHTALLALETKKPVKMTFTRQESIKYHSKRHSMEMEFTTACDENGKLTALKAIIIADTGAYASVGENVIEKCCMHSAGPYNYQNINIKGMSVFTNNISAGAFRGFGVTQSNFAIESNLNRLAELAGISAWEIRYKNAVDVGDILPNGQIADSDTALKETLISVKDFFYSKSYVGIACAMKNMGDGVGSKDVGKCVLLVKNDKVIIKSDIAFSGQGIETALIQIVCQTTGLLPGQIKCECMQLGSANTSKHTFFIGEAVRRASLKLQEALINSTLRKLNGSYYIGEYVSVTDPIDSKKDNPISHISYAYATHCVALDEDGKVKKVIASHDVGKAINPINIQGQIQGGVTMALGYALSEKVIVKNGVVQGDFGSLGVLRANQVPEIDVIIVEKNLSKLAYGAKGVAEISAIPTVAALQGAYMKFDGIFRTKLPLEDTAYNKKKLKKNNFAFKNMKF
ncbi:MAG: selenium-dependent xanthine dehydrogenase [Peptoanaerobacter stomatis]|uniref:selenium-dependent xanthine dehydrogenase n=1 Tax=Peptoanaerobacter stomatis TaxID=796937 RepID=UPI003F9F8CDF